MDCLLAEKVEDSEQQFLLPKSTKSKALDLKN